MCGITLSHFLIFPHASMPIYISWPSLDNQAKTNEQISAKCDDTGSDKEIKFIHFT